MLVGVEIRKLLLSVVSRTSGERDGEEGECIVGMESVSAAKMGLQSVSAANVMAVACRVYRRREEKGCNLREKMDFIFKKKIKK